VEIAAERHTRHLIEASCLWHRAFHRSREYGSFWSTAAISPSCLRSELAARQRVIMPAVAAVGRADGYRFVRELEHNFTEPSSIQVFALIAAGRPRSDRF
jgi:hypothetical protein